MSAQRTSDANADRARRKSDPRATRELLIALALGAFGALGALPVTRNGADPLALLTWLALIAIPSGALAAALDVRLLPFGVAAPGVWMGVLVSVAATSERVLPTPFFAALVWSGLYVGGHALARFLRRSRFAFSAALLLASAALIGLPSKAGLASEPWPSSTARLALDLSPAALLCESAGASDWMWHRGNYANVGIDRFQREPWRGKMAGPIALVAGCLLALGAHFLERARSRSGTRAE